MNLKVNGQETDLEKVDVVSYLVKIFSTLEEDELLTNIAIEKLYKISERNLRRYVAKDNTLSPYTAIASVKNSKTRVFGNKKLIARLRKEGLAS